MTTEEFATACKDRLATLYEERSKKQGKHFPDPFKAFTGSAPTLRLEVNAAVLEFAKQWSPPTEE
jgi:hypothetical protein